MAGAELYMFSSGTLGLGSYEVPVKRILMGVPAQQAASVESLADPHSLDYFVELAETL